MATKLQKTIQEHIFRIQGHNLTASKKVFRDAVFNDPQLKIALAKYIDSFNLQGQINKNGLSEDRALAIFHKATTDFKNHTHTEINRLFTKHQIDQTDLSNPLNMQTALSNPNSIAYQMMNVTTTSLGGQQDVLNQQNNMDDIICSEMANLTTQLTEEIEANDKYNNEQQQTESSTLDRELEKGGSIIGAIKAMDDLEPHAAKAVIEKSFHDVTHITGGSFEHIEKLAKTATAETEDFAMKLTPKSIKMDDED